MDLEDRELLDLSSLSELLDLSFSLEQLDLSSSSELLELLPRMNFSPSAVSVSFSLAQIYTVSLSS